MRFFLLEGRLCRPCQRRAHPWEQPDGTSAPNSTGCGLIAPGGSGSYDISIRY